MSDLNIPDSMAPVLTPDMVRVFKDCLIQPWVAERLRVLPVAGEDPTEQEKGWVVLLCLEHPGEEVREELEWWTGCDIHFISPGHPAYVRYSQLVEHFSEALAFYASLLQPGDDGVARILCGEDVDERLRHEYNRRFECLPGERRLERAQVLERVWMMWWVSLITTGLTAWGSVASVGVVATIALIFLVGAGACLLLSSVALVLLSRGKRHQ